MPSVWIDPDALQEIKRLPGHIRQRVRRAIKDLADDPRPANARKLTAAEITVEAWRLRFGRWRIIYTYDESDDHVIIWAVRRRPPYDYTDLEDLLPAP